MGFADLFLIVELKVMGLIMNCLKKIKAYAGLGIILGVTSFAICSLYNRFIAEFIDIETVMGIFSILFALQAVLSSFIYNIIKNHLQEISANNQDSNTPV